MRGTTTPAAKGRKVAHEMRTRFVDCIHVLQVVPPPSRYQTSLGLNCIISLTPRLTPRASRSWFSIHPPRMVTGTHYVFKRNEDRGVRELVHTHRSPTQIGIGHRRFLKIREHRKFLFLLDELFTFPFSRVAYQISNSTFSRVGNAK